MKITYIGHSGFLAELPEDIVRERTGARREAEQMSLF